MKTAAHSIVATWEECDLKLRSIESENAKSLSGVYFRGLSSADWPLTTTLERRRNKSFSVKEYIDLVRRMLPEVEAFTGQKWDAEAVKWSDPKEHFADFFPAMPAFSYLAHLRHHGFPSPLLDWTRSPYVAAYFAFAQARPEDGKNVALFVFSETPNNFKGISSDRPQICAHGGFALKTHPRHFRQQSSYTVCVEQVRPNAPNLVLDCAWRFVPHQSVFDFTDPEEDQDRLYKIEVPSTERTKVLALLDRFNLNHFSLFGSEESLMETLAFRWIDNRNT